MEDYIGDSYLKSLFHRRLNIIYGSIFSYCSIFNFPGRPHMIKRSNKVMSVLCDIEYDRLGAKEDINNRAMGAEDQGKKKSEQKQMRDDDERLKGLETCEVLVRSVLAFGMDHINNLKMKELRVLL